MRNSHSYKRSMAFTMPLILSAVAAGAPAMAQDADDEDVGEFEEIVVTGIKASLSSAQNIKENANTFVDAITAEDIGALADRSVAEALQRVPGVNIGRFKKSTDPDRFSVEGADVVIRGLPFVRSELNGREVFSATGGRVLSFNDVSPELLGAVKVFKNSTADMIDGGISGTVDLITRKPLDNDGLRVAGAVEANYGDLAGEWSPGFSIMASNSWETSGGRFGLQLGYSQSELVTRSDASQVTDPCYRNADLSGGCIRYRTVTDGGVGDDTGAFTPDTFPPADAVIAPKGAGVRTTGYERDRNAFSAVGQWENEDGTFLVTAEYLRAEADLFVDEHAILAQVNNEDFAPREPSPGAWNFDQNGMFQSGILAQDTWHGFNNCAPGTYDTQNGEFSGTFAAPGQPCDIVDGLPTEFLRFQRQDEAVTEDFSLDIQWSPSERMDVNLEFQHISSKRSEDGVIGAVMGRSVIDLDLSGGTPDVSFQAPLGDDDAAHFANEDRHYAWFLLDSLIDNEGDLTSFRADIDYDLGEDRFFKKVKFGARWADRSRITRDNSFGNWGNLSNAWTWTDTPKNPVYLSNPGEPGSATRQNPFAEFQRGNVATPVPGGEGFFLGGEDLLGEYYDGTLTQRAEAIREIFGAGFFGGAWGPVGDRSGLVEGTPFLPSEISDVKEDTKALYAQVDFGNNVDPGNGLAISGNIGLRYVKTTIQSAGEIQFALAEDAPDFDTACMDPGTGGNVELPPYCFLSAARQAEFLEGFTGEIVDDSADIKFEHWLPSFNIKLGLTEDFLIRGAVSKGISRPDLGAFKTGGLVGSNVAALRSEGTLDSGPLFALTTGNRLLRPTTAWSYDLSAEWYFSRVGSLTASLFLKDFSGLISQSASLRDFESDTATVPVLINGPTNVDGGTIKGLEIAYQQTFDFLPGFMKHLGMQATYTYVDDGAIPGPENDVRRSAFADGSGFPGLSKDTINLTGFYEDSKLAVRLAYNWRSEFLITPRDDIFPYSPIFGESTGQLDGSIFYTVRDGLKVGVQAVNLLDEVTKTSQLIDFDGTRVTRSAFRNDRRFTFLVRFDF